MLSLASALAAGAPACGLIDLNEYEETTFREFTTVILSTAEEASGLSPDARQVAIQVYGDEYAEYGCQYEKLWTRCEVTVQEDGALLIDFSVRYRILVDSPWFQSQECTLALLVPGGECGDVVWPDGEELRIVDEAGVEYIAEPNAALPLFLGVDG